MKIKTRFPLLLFCLVLLGGVIGSPVRAQDDASTGARRPNIVLFFVDDMGVRDLGCYGSPFYETPHIDQLAADGMRFTNAYAAYPRCVQSRIGLLSGKYPNRVNFSAFKAKEKDHSLPLSEVTFGEALKKGGYDTCYIGKWHLGHEGGGPGAQGFDTVIHSGSAGATHSYFFPFGSEKGLTVDNPVQGKEGDYLNDLLTDKGVEYIKEHAQSGPFLLVLAHYAVHTPFEAPESLTDKYRKKCQTLGIEEGGTRKDSDLVTDRQGDTKTVQNNPVYAAMVASTDASLGRIVDAIHEAGIEQNTVIILTSDHGGLSTRGLSSHRPLATSNLPYRQGKGSIFEGGTRVPMIVKWPGKIRPGSTSTVQVTGPDHYPSMLEIAGLPLRPQQHVDGRSYLKALEGETYQRDPMFWYKWMARPDSTGDTRAISMVDGNFKIIEWIDEDLVELFDLSKDPGEKNNLANQMPEKTKAMLEQLKAFETSTGNLRRRGLKQLERRLEKLKRRKDRQKKRKKEKQPLQKTTQNWGPRTQNWGPRIHPIDSTPGRNTSNLRAVDLISRYALASGSSPITVASAHWFIADWSITIKSTARLADVASAGHRSEQEGIDGSIRRKAASPTIQKGRMS